MSSTTSAAAISGVTLAKPAPRWVFFAVFTISGFSGLIYESIWTHYLKLFLGHAAYAQSLVLIIFMGGLAVVFHQTFVAMSDTLYFSLLPDIDSVLLGALLKWSAAAALILPQSV